MAPGILGPTTVAFLIGLPLGQSPCARLFLRAYLSTKTLIFYAVRVILCVGLPHDESLVEKWIVLLDLNDILMQMMRTLEDFLNREWVKGDYFKTLPSWNDTLVQMYVRSAICSMTTQWVYTCHHNCVQSSSSSHRRQWSGF